LANAQSIFFLAVVDLDLPPVEIVKRTPLSRPFFGRNKLWIGGSDFSGAARSRPRHSGA
jgi:hypothetical protein